jgi:hypothetical protein
VRLDRCEPRNPSAEAALASTKRGCPRSREDAKFFFSRRHSGHGEEFLGFFPLRLCVPARASREVFIFTKSAKQDRNRRRYPWKLCQCVVL